MSPAPLNHGDDPNLPQRRAADPAASVWVAASAGTGKTKVLTDRVLALLLAGTAPQRILCLTYTRAAAAEMAIRLQKALGAWTAADDATLDAAIAGLTGKPSTAEARARARALFALVLDCPGGLNIRTIHAFCESLLRRFPVEAGLAPHFRVLEEAEARLLLAAARDEVIARAAGFDGGGGEDTLARAMARIAARVSGEGFDHLLAALAAERGRIARFIAAHGGLDAAADAIARMLGVGPTEEEADVIAAACAEGAFDAPALRAAARAMAEGSEAEQARGTALAAFLAAAARAADFDDYCALFLTKENTVRKALLTKAALKSARDPDAALAAMEAEAQRLIAARERCLAARTAQGSIAALTLGAALIEGYERRKRAAARLDYDDLILRAGALLSTSAAAQWVLYKLDGGIDHVLVDEAQDTSPDQWEVIRRLTAEFFAGLGAREEAGEPARSIFAVGDAKQSIYSFQHAEPRRFAEMRAHYAGAVAGAGGEFRDVGLHHSFRSTAPVLEAVDRVFAGEPARDGVALAADAIAHVTRRGGQAGWVELWPLMEPESQGPARPWEAVPAAEGRADAAAGLGARERLARLIAARIQGWIGTLNLPSRGRKMRAGDVLVLVRTRTRFVDALVRALKRLDVGVAGVDRMRLADELAIQDLIALGRFLILPEDDYSLACVLKGPYGGLGDEDLLALAPSRAASLWASLNARAGEDPAWEEARARLAGLLARTDFTRPFELFSAVLDEDDGRARLIARLGAEAEDPVNEFLELALAFERGEAPSLQGFLDWLEGGQSEIKRDLEQAERDEVRIMTVHGAKGLEAPVVILPDTTAMPKAPEPPFWLEAGEGAAMPVWAPAKDDLDPVGRDLREAKRRAGEQEYHRLLYVAMTRAEDALVVAGWRARNEPNPGCWYNLVAAGLDGLAAPVSFDFTGLIPGVKGMGFFHQCPQEGAPDRPEPEARPAPGAVLAGWEDRAPPPEEARRPLAPSLPPEGGEGEAVLSPLGAPAGINPFLKGRLVHGLLEVLPEVAPASRAAAASRFLARPSLGLDEAMRAAIASETLALLDDPAFAALFGPDSLAEVPVTGMIGEAIVSGQVDRLVVKEAEVLVVDYKTARPVPADAAEVPPAYLRQMALYRGVLRQAFPGRAVRCALLYTAAPRLVALPEAALDALSLSMG